MTKPKLTGTRPRLGAQPGGPGVPVGAVYTQLAAGGQLRTVAIDQIDPDPGQARRTFDPDALATLAASISELGVLQPPLVTTLRGGRYQLIAGERRWRAAKLAGVTELQVLVRDQVDVALAALAENLQREDLDPIDEATAYARVIREHAITIAEFARRLGLSRPAVSNALRLLELSEPIQHHLRSRRLSKRHGRELLSEADPVRREELARQAADGEWTVRRLAVAIARTSRPAGATPGDERAARATAVLSAHFARQTVVRRAGNGYRATMTFATPDELDAFVAEHAGQAGQLW
ncbi:Stage 0 sporulation protein J [Paraconexibacter sp. AEG42_29]|uniref:Stage 0 sporulation protein J n=1 Tax=Paraconexibacter sp. AEG42_29 TaxID=2997339 RepID=A0AAU7API5_9ACTN